MNIIGIEAQNAINYISSKNTSTLKNSNDIAATEVSDSFEESESTSKFKQITSKYDITNISGNEAKQMYKELYDSHLINLKDMLVTFDYSKIPGFQSGVTTVSGAKISGDSNEKINLLDQLKTQADYNKRYGNNSFQNIFDERVNLAEKIQDFQSQ